MKAELENPYAALGLPNGANQEEIKTAFYKVCKQHHPDVAGADQRSHQAFAAAKRAYELLGDPVSKAQFDRSSQVRTVHKVQWHPDHVSVAKRRQPCPGPPQASTKPFSRNLMSLLMLSTLCIPVYLVGRDLRGRLQQDGRWQLLGRRKGQHFVPLAERPASESCDKT